MDNRKISVCIPTYNRYDMTVEAIESVLNDSRVSEIIVCDDASHEYLQAKLLNYAYCSDKIKVHLYTRNAGVYENKMRAVRNATNEYVVILDSDNKLSKEYIDAIFSCEWKPNEILAPVFAKPTFDYRKYAGVTFSKQNIANYIGQPGIDCTLNTMNYFVHRTMYLLVWMHKDGIIGADSIYFNYLWLLAGNSIHMLKGMEYDHRVHDGSYYVSVAEQSAPLTKKIEELMLKMR